MKVLSSTIFICTVFLSACSGLKDIENYKGDNLSMGVNDTSSVSMTADTQNGYDWIVASNSDPTVARYTGKENLAGTNSTDKTTQVIKFKGLKKGKTIITLNYVKKGDLLAKQSRTLNITVY
ncbi:MAG: protease inhibitor I42 family protein [Ignavibacteria bacterium]